MLSKTIRILDLDGSVIRQEGLISRYQAEVIQAADIGPRARLWLDQAVKVRLEERLKNSMANALTFIGSGDFHHITYLLAARFTEPFTLIVFDFHPDWDILPPRLGCGSWVSAALREPQVAKCLLLGVSSEDISSFSIQTGDLSALKNDRVEIYPYSHPPSRTFLRKIPENISINARNGIISSEIRWMELKTRRLGDFFKTVISRVPTRKVYLSIDKDCLQSAYAATNWEEGQMPLEDLLFMVRLIKEEKEIIGADIVGDHSPVLIDGWFKRKCSDWDHPKETSAAGMRQEEIRRINELTNIKLAEVLTAG